MNNGPFAHYSEAKLGKIAAKSGVSAQRLREIKKIDDLPREDQLRVHDAVGELAGFGGKFSSKGHTLH